MSACIKLKSDHKRISWLTMGLIAAVPLSAGLDAYSVEDDAELEPKKPQIVYSFSAHDFKKTSNFAEAFANLGLEDDYRGGIAYVYWSEEKGDWIITGEGHVLVNPLDLSISLSAVKPEEAELKIEYTRWKEFDSPVGAFYPPANRLPMLGADALEEEISRLKISYKWIPSDTITWKVSFDSFLREGQSLATTFGDDFQYLYKQTVSRGYIPSFVDGKEEVHKLDVSVRSEEEAKRQGVRVSYQRRNVDRTRVTERGESHPETNRYQTQADDSKDDLFGFSAYARRNLTDSITGSLGLAVTRLDGDITGSRIFGASPEARYDIDFVRSQLDDRGFIDLEGTRKLKQVLMNANLVYEPWGNWRMMGGIRIEDLTTEAFSSYIDTIDTIAWQDDLTRQNQEGRMESVNDKQATDYSGFLEVRYKGFSKAMLYTRAEYAEQEGDLEEGWTRENLVPNPDALVRLLDRATDFERETGFWEAGVHFYPASAFRISLEGYLKEKDYDYEFNSLSMADFDYTLYPSYIQGQNFQIEDVNARIHWKLGSTVRGVTRFDVQNTTIDTMDRLHPRIQSAERERTIFNQAVVWTPSPKLFFNAIYNKVNDLTETPATDIGDLYDGLVVNLPNDYWQLDLNMFVVLTKTVDLQLGYHFLEIDNYIDNSAVTVPLGDSIQQQHVFADFLFRFDEKTSAKVGFHYYEQNDTASAGNRDYQVMAISSSFQYIF
ncbi:MAG: hypothetical protein AB3N63_13740 [Puniceicoccaceae bacterium]